ncbi:ankyrin repeat domain-containing protein [Paenibacillus allorhizosphaerae]|uniref:Ankyrin repeat domain-containing protein n=1 Tax=Paenibacillus allorhizosphaerae TaxID=2849866 RepID=A0ABN7TB00_9BACL|nr:ankyrin repeat domain-containing protein [Paenibacillus allorhizosphaerae]CAG7617155.1 hypothetical protein PAECIP111802_00372 [Paenibacillus allorhizosphaerae]
MRMLHFKPLPVHSGPEQYERQANSLLETLKSGQSEISRSLHGDSPFLEIPAPAMENGELPLHEARLIIARGYGFESWEELTRFAMEASCDHSPVAVFESAVEAIIAGDTAALESLVGKRPSLIRERSLRSHQATLLHYIGANGVEAYRQRTPGNAVQIAALLLRAGAEVDAVAAMYGKDTSLSLVATSVHPARAGVQIALMETLLEAGAAIDGAPGDMAIVNACLANGRPEAAAFLAGRGARLDLEGAAGLGRLDRVKSFFDEDGRLKANATVAQMESGFMWACEYGRIEVVEFLLDHGVEAGMQARGMTGLHWAVVGGLPEIVKLLLKRGAPLETKNTYGATVLGQAVWAANHSDPVCHWPIVEPDWGTTIRMLIDAGADTNAYPGLQERMDEVLRRYEANS